MKRCFGAMENMKALESEFVEFVMNPKRICSADESDLVLCSQAAACSPVYPSKLR